MKKAMLVLKYERFALNVAKFLFLFFLRFAQKFGERNILAC